MQGCSEGSPIICWIVNAVNWISMPGVIELMATEYYSNEDIDEVGELPEYKEIMKKIELEESIKAKEEEQPIVIIGDNFIKPKVTYTYSCSVPGVWKIEGKNCPIQILSQTNTTIKIKWDKLYSGQFVLKCGDIEKTIVVETLF